jgi:prophage antirepressor-like protein
MKMNLISKMFEGSKLTIIANNGEPVFLLKDVCSILELGQVAGVKRRLSDDVISNHPIIDALGRTQQATFVNEDGLYDVILDSRKPEAKSFRKWITSDVLPSIRREGAYMTPDTLEKALMDPDIIINIATRLKEAQQQREIERQKREQAEKVIHLQQPKVAFAESCLASQDSILVRELAKLASKQGVRIGQNKLYEVLRDWGYIQKRNTEPTQKAVDAGYMEVLQRAFASGESTRLARTTKITTKGQMHIINRLKKEF